MTASCSWQNRFSIPRAPQELNEEPWQAGNSTKFCSVNKIGKMTQ